MSRVRCEYCNQWTEAYHKCECCGAPTGNGGVIPFSDFATPSSAGFIASDEFEEEVRKASGFEKLHHALMNKASRVWNA